MSVKERDPVSGYKTTGHEWNGIKELNTPVPKPIWFFLIAAVIFSVVLWILMPAWPTGTGYTKGILGVDQHDSVQKQLVKAATARADWRAQLMAVEPDLVKDDEALMQIVRETGHMLFGDNCSVCHGTNARGSMGFPNLVDGSWLWGGDVKTIEETLRVGVNDAHEETRFGQMPAFGRDQMLGRDDIITIITYVRSLSGQPDVATAENQDVLARGADLFLDNCSACHGEDAKGLTMMGAPDLTDGNWLYGGDRQALFETLWNGRQGHMPSWEGRLDAVDRRILALYVLDLQGRAP